MDEAEQLCDRLVIMDNGKIVAEGSPTQLIAEHSTREVLELRFPVGTQDRGVERIADLARRIEELPDRVLLYTDDADATALAVTERGRRPGVHGHPALHARRRLPPPHRQETGRLMALTSLRVVEAGARVYRRTWRGSVISTFLNPVLFLLAMGVGLGQLVDEGSGTATLDLPYLTFLAPGLLAATAMQTAAGDSSYPVMAGHQVAQDLRGGPRHPARCQRPGDRPPHAGWVSGSRSSPPSTPSS